MNINQNKIGIDALSMHHSLIKNKSSLKSLLGYYGIQATNHFPMPIPFLRRKVLHRINSRYFQHKKNQMANKKKQWQTKRKIGDYLKRFARQR